MMKPRRKITLVLNTLLSLSICILIVACSSKAKAKAPTTIATTTTTLNAAEQKDADTAIIRHMVEYINTAYRESSDSGNAADASANYYVWHGKYTADKCIAFLKSRYRGLHVSVDYVFHPESVAATPDWVDTLSGNPKGRIYSFTVDYTLSAPGAQDSKGTNTVHATILPDGTAKQFLSCE